MSESTSMRRLRRRATKHGCRIVKSRVRNPQAAEYSTMMLVDSNTSAIVLGSWEYCSQEDIEDVLDEWEHERSN